MADSRAPHAAATQTQRQEYINLTFVCLRESIGAGYRDFDFMQQDPNLAILRDVTEFQALIPTPPEPNSEQECPM